MVALQITSLIALSAVCQLAVSKETNAKASASASASAVKKVQATRPINYETIDRIMNLAVPIRWKDHVSRELPSVGEVHQLFNNEAADSVACPSGSVRMFYRDASYNQHDVVTEVWSDWITSNNNESYYANEQMGYVYNAEYVTPLVNEALVDALNQMDQSYFEFNQFDKDKDGEIDSITFLHSGYNAEHGYQGTITDCNKVSPKDRIHSQSRKLLNPWISNDGTKIQKIYFTSGMWGVCGDTATRMGRLAHAIGSNLGLPYLGDRVSGGRGVGAWDLMSYERGFPDDDAQTELYPSMLSAYSKIQLGFVEPIIIKEEGLYIANNSYYYPAVFKIQEGFPVGEYLLIENKIAVGFDKYIPGEGLAIYHVDENILNNPSKNKGGYPGKPGMNWPENGEHYAVSMLQADGIYGLEVDGARNNWQLKNFGDAGDLFAASGVASLTKSDSPQSGPYPNTDSYQNGNVVKSLVRIYDISASGEFMTFKVQFNAGEPTNAPTFAPTNVPTTLVPSMEPTNTEAPVSTTKSPTNEPLLIPVPVTVPTKFPVLSRSYPTRLPTQAFTMLPTIIAQANFASSSSGDEGLDAGASAGVAFAVIFFLVILAAVAYAFRGTLGLSRNKEQDNNNTMASGSADPQVTVTVDNVYPDVERTARPESNPESPRNVAY